MEDKRINSEIGSGQAETEKSPVKPFEVRRQAQTMTTQDYVAVIDTHRDEAEAILPADVKTPDRPIHIFLQEGSAIAKSALRHQGELGAVGLKRATIDRLVNLLVVLEALQVMLHIELGEAEFDRVLSIADPARELRDWMLLASELALRNQKEGLARLSTIKEQKTQDDLVSNLIDLAVLAADYRPQFEEEVCMDVDDVARRLNAKAIELRETLASAGTARYLPNTRELRDRVYTLALQPLGEIRAYAAFAFRHEPGSRKRASFTSPYVRARNRKARSKKNAGPSRPAAVVPASPATAPVPVTTLPTAPATAPGTAEPAGEEGVFAQVA